MESDPTRANDPKGGHAREFVPSTDRIYEAVLHRVGKVLPHSGQLKHLDIGAGSGLLLKQVRERFPVEQFACDYSANFMKHSDAPVEIVDLDSGKLPYSDSSFDLITCVETIEHLENFRALFREMNRILKPAGAVIITTPNILNLRSRLRFLGFGFYNMFGPLHVRRQKNFDTRGHISPTSWFYLGHALLQAGFVNLNVTVDHLQRRSVFALALLYLPIRLAGAISLGRERRANIASITPENEPLVRDINRIELLLGRTLIISAQKG
jgi:SAM-dependent methyltransferase